MPVDFIGSIIFSLLRHGLTALAGYLAAKGLMTESAQEQFIAAGIGAVTVLWSWAQKLGNDGIASSLRAVADRIDPKVVAGALALMLAFGVGTADAAPKPKQQSRGLVSNVVASLSSGDIIGQISARSLVDLELASALAKTANTPQAIVRAKCWDEWIYLIRAQNGIQTAASGLTLGVDQVVANVEAKAMLFTRAEQLAQFNDAMQPGSPFMTACSPVAAQVKSSMSGFITTILKGGLSLASFGLGL